MAISIDQASTFAGIQISASRVFDAAIVRCVYVSDRVGLAQKITSEFVLSIGFEQGPRIGVCNVFEYEGRRSVDHGSTFVAGRVDYSERSSGSIASSVDADANSTASNLLEGECEGMLDEYSC